MEISSLIKVCVLLFLLTTGTTSSDDYENVALHKPTRQIEPISVYGAENVVDGSSRTDLPFCSHTSVTSNTWWVVDLLHTYKIFAIEMSNRNSEPERLTDFYIYVSSVKPLPIPRDNGSFTGQLCLHHPDTFPKNGPFPVFCDSPLKGRYVYVWKPAHEFLTICEFILHVNEQKRDMECSISQQQKSGLAPIYWEYVKTVTLFHCVNMCLLSPEGTPSIVQLDKRSGKCECIYYSPLIHPSEEITQDQNFDMCRIINYLSIV